MSRLLLPRLGSRSQPDEIKPDEIKTGDRYRRQHRGRIFETATVLDLCNDLLGIPHVRFAVDFEQNGANPVHEGRRILALSSFIDTYRTRVV